MSNDPNDDEYDSSDYEYCDEDRDGCSRCTREPILPSGFLFEDQCRRGVIRSKVEKFTRSRRIPTTKGHETLKTLAQVVDVQMQIWEALSQRVINQAWSLSRLVCSIAAQAQILALQQKSSDDLAEKVEAQVSCLETLTQNVETGMNSASYTRRELQLVLFLIPRPQSSEDDILETKADSENLEDQVQSLEDLASSVKEHILCLHAHTKEWKAEMNSLDDEMEELQLVLSMIARAQIGEADMLQTKAESESLDVQAQTLEADRQSMMARAQDWVAKILEPPKRKTCYWDGQHDCLRALAESVGDQVYSWED